MVYQKWTVDLALFSHSLRAQPTVEPSSSLIRQRTPYGASDQPPYSSLIIHLLTPPSVSIPLSSIALPLSLSCSLYPSSLILSIHPSVLISREASPINLFKQPSERPIHSNVAVWERASALSQDLDARTPLRCPPQPPLHLTTHSLLLPPIISILIFRLLSYPQRNWFSTDQDLLLCCFCLLEWCDVSSAQVFEHFHVGSGLGMDW